MKYREHFEELIRKLNGNEIKVSELRELFRILRNDRSVESSDLPNPPLDILEPDVDQEKYATIWDKVERYIEPIPVRKSVWQLPFVRAAAVLAILVIAGVTGGKIYQSYSWTNYITQIGEIKTIELQDGSTVVLNGNSHLKVPRNLSTAVPRDVYMTGEANFHVTQAETVDARFVVHTENIQVEVLGTKFNVNSRDHETEVYLEEGSVKVTQDDSMKKEMFMSPGEKIKYSSEEQKLKLIEVESEVNEISWRKGVFEFENLTLEKILQQITDPYNYKYNIECNELKGRTFTVRIPHNDLEFVVSVLEKLTGAIITDINGTLVVSEGDNSSKD